MADVNAILEARRRQAEAKAARNVFYPRGERIAGKTVEEAIADECRREEERLLSLRLEGFVLGWLVATGKFEQYAELAEIWLDTPKLLDTAVADCSDVADPIERFKARLKLPVFRGKKKGRS